MKIYRKYLVIGLMILFIGASVVPSISGNVETDDSTHTIKNLHVEYYWPYLEVKTESDTLIFYPTDDAFVSEAEGHGDNNYGDGIEFHVANKYGKNPGWERNIFIKFDISTIPPGTAINYATLNLYYYYFMDTNPVGRPLTVYRVIEEWSEDTITYNTQPPNATEVSSSVEVPNSYQWMECSLTQDVQEFIDGIYPNYGWKIMDETYWGMVDVPVTHFYSKEFDEENEPPEVNIIAPREGFIYLGRFKLLPTFFDLLGDTVNIAKIFFIIDADDFDGIFNIKCYLNGEYKGNADWSDREQAWVYDYKKTIFDFCTIKAEILDNAGKSSEVEMDLFWICFF